MLGTLSPVWETLMQFQTHSFCLALAVVVTWRVNLLSVAMDEILSTKTISIY